MFSNKAELKVELDRFIANPTVLPRLDALIALCEERLRTLFQEQTSEWVAEGVVDRDSRAPLPSDYNGMVWVKVNGRKVTELTPEKLAGMPQEAGCPINYAIQGEELRFWPLIPDFAQLQICYNAFPKLLNADTDTNWILDRAPSLYLYGTLIESSRFLMDDRAPEWEKAYSSSLLSFKNELNKRKSGRGIQIVRQGRGAIRV